MLLDVVLCCSVLFCVVFVLLCDVPCWSVLFVLVHRYDAIVVLVFVLLLCFGMIAPRA